MSNLVAIGNKLNKLLKTEVVLDMGEDLFDLFRTQLDLLETMPQLLLVECSIAILICACFACTFPCTCPFFTRHLYKCLYTCVYTRKKDFTNLSENLAELVHRQAANDWKPVCN